MDMTESDSDWDWRSTAPNSLQAQRFPVVNGESSVPTLAGPQAYNQISLAWVAVPVALLVSLLSWLYFTSTKADLHVSEPKPFGGVWQPSYQVGY